MRDFLNSRIRVFIKGLQKKIVRLELRLSKENPDNPRCFDDLTPIDNADEQSVYLDALQWALTNPKIKNIALSGPYGSGKSSIVKTFEKKNPGYHYLNISLAAFQEDDIRTALPGAEEKNAVPAELGKVMETKVESNEVSRTKEKRAEEQRLIELSILQQMFYRVKETEIPDSRFNRIRSLSRLKLTYLVFIVIIFTLSISIVFFPKFFDRFSGWQALYKNNTNLILLAAVLSLISGTIEFLIYIFRLFNTSKFNKLNIASGSIEINPKSETSILNKHLDEILYFFEVTRYNVVVIEDLDRFNDPEIFTKLRELNILVNNSRQINRRIIFIYAIKDDMFRDKTRTKFFDFIIPVIPVINSSNSFEIMLRKIRNPGLSLQISETFLSDITLYVDDMRALKNIFNEFIIYKDNLEGINVKHEKLLGIIIYKNIYPDDFASLHRGEGLIYRAFVKQADVVGQITKGHLEKIDVLDQKICDLKLISQKNTNELRASYLFEIMLRVPNATSLKIKNDNISFQDLRSDPKQFAQLTKVADINYYYTNQHSNQIQSTNTGIAFQTIEKTVNSEYTYAQRLDLVETMLQHGSGEIVKEIERLHGEMEAVQSMPLRELLEAYPTSVDHFEPEFRQRKLLVYLIREGYIDEMYPSLISYFYEGSLLVKDMEFLMSVKNRESLPFTSPLDKLPAIMSRLRTEEFKRESILNYNLLDFLLRNESLYKARFDLYFLMLASEHPKSVAFIDGYIENGRELPRFFNLICRAWPNIWTYIYNHYQDKKNAYLKLIIQYADSEDYVNLDHNALLSSYITEKADFLDLLTGEGSLPKMRSIISELQIKFKRLTIPEATDELFTFVYQNDYYELNRNMITLILARKGTETEFDQTSSNYTAIQHSGCENLIAYVDSDIQRYVDTIILGSPLNINEAEHWIVELTEKDELSLESKILLLQQQEHIFDDIVVVEPEFWPELIAASKVRATWQNMLEYFETTGDLDRVLTGFLNAEKNYTELSSKRIDTVSGKPKDLLYKISRLLVLSTEISEQAYPYLVRSIPYYYPASLKITTLSAQKVAVLILLKTIRLTKEYFNIVNDQFPGSRADFLIKNIEEFLKLPEDYPVTAEDFVKILNAEEVSEKQKLKIVPLVGADLVEEEKELADQLMLLLIKNTTLAVEDDLLENVLRYGAPPHRKVKLFQTSLNKFSHSQITAFLSVLGPPYSGIAIKRKRPLLVESDENVAIVTQLKSVKYISNYKIEKEGIRVITKNN
ncbi:YobI family P-loop NTPase [Mucilaginibacter paludis]|uniref:NTPase with transmembrane helices n=1 Tax=Mucilaginibacter paludis DSM 18603 TaxID=714943 RepID=H1YA63_9SPHI|nr:hypothetical protein [Mucilaginibacter paludis]EHQ25944.1 NTPase with transmembrane helices [Mucilaginibacter paludis DSM 18603]